MPLTNFPNGLSSFGLPVLGVGSEIPATTGSVFFVHSVTGSSGYSGRSPDKPKATINQAYDLCTASKFDVIVVMPGHAETISGATSLVMDTIGVQIIGLGTGSLRPTLTFSATSSLIPISVANNTIQNIVFYCNIDNCVNPIAIAAGGIGTTLRNIEMRDAAANKEFLAGITIAAGATDVTIDGLNYFGFAGGGASSCIVAAGAAHRFRLTNSYIQGDFSASIVDLLTAASTDVFIANNTAINIDTTAGLGIQVKADTNGFMVQNNVMNLKDTVVGVVGAAMGFCENYCTNAVTASGIIKPAVDS